MKKVRIKCFGNGMRVCRLNISENTKKDILKYVKENKITLYDFFTNSFLIDRYNIRDKELIALGLKLDKKTQIEIWRGRRKVGKINSNYFDINYQLFPPKNIKKKKNLELILTNGFFEIENEIGTIGVLSTNSNFFSIEDFTFEVHPFLGSKFITRILLNGKPIDLIKTDTLITSQHVLFDYE